MRKLGELEINKVHHGYCPEALKQLPDECVQTIITSPPYWGLRAYHGVKPQIWGDNSDCEHEWGEEKVSKRPGGPSDKQDSNAGSRFTATSGQFCTKCGSWKGCLGLEPTPELYVEHLVEIFREARRVLRKDGQLWLNLADSFIGGGRGGLDGIGKGGMEETRYQRGQRMGPPTGKVIGHKKKDQACISFMTYIALGADGWYMRGDIILSKKNPMPESVTDRCARSHEFVFMLNKSERYYFDHHAIKEPAAGKQTWDGEAPLDLEDKNREKGLTDHAASRRYPTDRSCGTSPTGMRNKRSVWEVTTRPSKEAHFAVFDDSWIEPMILAGTSEHGSCAACGAPYERMVEQVNPLARTSGRGQEQAETQKDEGRISLQRPTGITNDEVGVYETVGWQKTCKCETDEVVPCVVLDPFSGSGTTVASSIKRGRDAIGFDASDEYVEEIAKYKIEQARSGLTKAEQKAGQRLLF